MEIGLWTFPTERSLAPGELAREAESRDFESLWFPDHSHIPVARRTPWPGGDELPDHYYRLFDPIVALTAAASATSRLRLGTGVALVAQRDPIQLAKEIATLDVLSAGRVLFGVGGGWNREEMRNHGTDPRRRWALIAERVEAIRRIWTQDQAEYHGELVDFDAIYSWPKPVQAPHPPIHVGGAAPAGMRRAIELGDGWMPLAGRGDDDFVALAATFRRQIAESGRDPASMQMTVYGAAADLADLEAFALAGVDRAVLTVPIARDEALVALDGFARIRESLAGGS